MTAPADPLAAIRRRTARISAAAGHFAGLPDGPGHLRELLRLLSHPQIDRLLGQAEQDHRDRTLAAGRAYLRCFNEAVAADPDAPARSARLRAPEDCDDVCVLEIEVPNMPADGDRATKRRWAARFEGFETRIHDRVQASDQAALGVIIIKPVRPGAAGA